MLAFVSLPIYIHAPQFFAQKYGISLAILGMLLLGVRAIDFLQDPFLGWLADRIGPKKEGLIGVAIAVLSLGLIGLFALSAPIAPPLWFAICLIIIFTAFSFLNILFYSQGVKHAERIGRDAHLSLAVWREGGALIGVCLAAMTPLLFEEWGAENPLALYSFCFSALALGAFFAMRGRWDHARGAFPREAFARILRDPVTKRLVIIAIINAAPVAVTSTLFLFFVEDVIARPKYSGPFLLAFFLAAAFAVPIWGRLAHRFGMKKALLGAMCLAVLSFLWAIRLSEGDLWAFFVISIASGAALGADMTFLPALFARRIAALSLAPGVGFGIWNFCNKASLGLAAGLTLPLLQFFGFQPGGENNATALAGLTYLYGGVPCFLKLAAIGMLSVTSLGEER